MKKSRFQILLLALFMSITMFAQKQVFTGTVVDSNGELQGILLLDEVRNIMFQPRLYNRFTVAQLMTPPADTLGVNDPMEDVMRKFDETEAAVLPVIDNEAHLIGYISRTRMYAMYRKMVADMSAE